MDPPLVGGIGSLIRVSEYRATHGGHRLGDHRRRPIIIFRFTPVSNTPTSSRSISEAASSLDFIHLIVI
ncbi:hypothetical protein L1887_10284 [Cichorium endivia]|nr:hypothetical protein L1887_10284 [Cichorium endivia]